MPGPAKLKSTLKAPGQREVQSDLHNREALGHGVFLVKSRLEEGRRIFEKTKVPFPLPLTAETTLKLFQKFPKKATLAKLKEDYEKSRRKFKEFMEKQVEEMRSFKSDMLGQTKKLKEVLDVDYKEIKNLFAEGQDKINEEAKWVGQLKEDVGQEMIKMNACERGLMGYVNGALEPDVDYFDKLKETRLVADKDLFGL